MIQFQFCHIGLLQELEIPIVASELTDSVEAQLVHLEEAWKLVLANKFDETLEYIGHEQYSSPMHALIMTAYHGAYGVLRRSPELLKVLLTKYYIDLLNYPMQKMLQIALKLSTVGLRLASAKRKKRGKTTRFIFSTDPNSFTDEEVRF